MYRNKPYKSRRMLILSRVGGSLPFASIFRVAQNFSSAGRAFRHYAFAPASSALPVVAASGAATIANREKFIIPSKIT